MSSPSRTRDSLFTGFPTDGAKLTPDVAGIMAIQLASRTRSYLCRAMRTVDGMHVLGFCVCLVAPGKWIRSLAQAVAEKAEGLITGDMVVLFVCWWRLSRWSEWVASHVPIPEFCREQDWLCRAIVDGRRPVGFGASGSPRVYQYRMFARTRRFSVQMRTWSRQYSRRAQPPSRTPAAALSSTWCSRPPPLRHCSTATQRRSPPLKSMQQDSAFMPARRPRKHYLPCRGAWMLKGAAWTSPGVHISGCVRLCAARDLAASTACRPMYLSPLPRTLLQVTNSVTHTEPAQLSPVPEGQV